MNTLMHTFFTLTYNQINLCTGRRASKNKAHSRQMVHNPIYEGPIYEIIDPQFHPPTLCRDAPCCRAIEPNLDSNLVNRNTELPLSGNVTAAVPTDTMSEDSYIVMCSARAATVPAQPANSNNNTIRYTVC